MLKRLFFVFVLLLGSNPCFAGTQWANAIGGASNDQLVSVRRTSDGNYIFAGFTDSFGHGSRDGWLVKTALDGSILWQNAYGGAFQDSFVGVRESPDGAYVVAGNASTARFANFPWVMKVVPMTGAVMWESIYTDSEPYDLSGLDVDSVTGDICVAGSRTILSPTNSLGAFVMRLDPNGSIIWSRRLLASGSVGIAVTALPDGHCVMAGFGDSFGPLATNDLWLVSIDQMGIAFQKNYGIMGKDNRATDIVQMPGGFAISGTTGDFGLGKFDGWVLLVDGMGNRLIESLYHGPVTQSLDGIVVTSDGGLAVAGSTDSYGSGASDAWVLKLAADLSPVWQNAYGGPTRDGAFDIDQTSSGGFVASGFTTSFGAGGEDALALALGPDGAIDPSCGTFVTPSMAAQVLVNTFLRNTTNPWQFLQTVRQPFDDFPIPTMAANTSICGSGPSMMRRRPHRPPHPIHPGGRPTPRPSL